MLDEVEPQQARLHSCAYMDGSKRKCGGWLFECAPSPRLPPAVTQQVHVRYDATGSFEQDVWNGEQHQLPRFYTNRIALMPSSGGSNSMNKKLQYTINVGLLYLNFVRMSCLSLTLVRAACLVLDGYHFALLPCVAARPPIEAIHPSSCS